MLSLSFHQAVYKKWPIPYPTKDKAKNVNLLEIDAAEAWCRLLKKQQLHTFPDRVDRGHLFLAIGLLSRLKKTRLIHKNINASLTVETELKS